MKRHVFVLATPLIATTIILAACSDNRNAGSDQTQAMDMREQAPMTEMAASESMSADAVAGPNVRVSAAPGVAFNYRYAFRVPDAKIAAVQEEHAAACWLPWQEAATRVFSWTNRDAIRLVARRFNAVGQATQQSFS